MPRKWTNEMFINELKAKHPSLEPLELYVNSKTKISVRCIECGTVWQTTPATLLNGRGCVHCSSRKTHLLQRKSHNEFARQLAGLNPNIEPIDNYIGAKTKIRFQCKRCGLVWWAKPNQVLSGSGCSNCARTSTSLFEQAIRFACISALPGERILPRDKTAIGAELDVYIPNRRIAFEPGSWVWHRDRLSSDERKSNLCKAKGIRLITIYTSCPIESSRFQFEVMTTLNPLSFGDWDEIVACVTAILEAADISCSCIDWAYVHREAVLHDRRRTTEEFRSMLHELHPNIEVLNEYVSATSDLQCRCLRCGYTWHSDAHKLLRGKGCLRCSGSWIPTNEEFCQRLANHNPNVQTLEPYLGADKKIKVRCLLCGNEWHAKPFDLSRGHGCPACGGNQKKNHGQFVAELARINPNIEILDEYTNSRGKIRCRCLVCGSEWEPIPNNLLRGASCPICSKGKTAARFTEEMRAVNPTIQLLDPYVRSKEKIKCKCLICGHTWAATPNNLLRGSGCPNCARSKTVRNLVSYSPRD